MNKFFSITVFFLLLTAVCWAGGNKDKGTQPAPQTQQQTAPQAQPQATPQSAQPQTVPVTPASPFFIGDGGKGMSIAILTPQANGLAENQGYLPVLVQGEFVSNFSGFSAISVLDRQRLDEQYAELFSGYYDDDAGTDLGHLTPTTHIMGGTITRTATGYVLQMQITKTADKMTAASHSGTITFAELDNLSGIRRASLELLKKIGVTPTERTQTELAGAATVNQVNAQTALARGITANQQGIIVEALNYFSEAVAFDSGFAEANRRLDGLTQRIQSGNIGENVRNEIQLRSEWQKLLEDAIAFYDKNPYFDLVYRTVPQQGTINFNRNTVEITFEYWLEPNARADAVYRILKALVDTKKMDSWGLRRLYNALESTSINGSAYAVYVEAELFADNGLSLGKTSSHREGNHLPSPNYNNFLNWSIHQSRIYINSSRKFWFTVNADKISDQMTLQFTIIGPANERGAKINLVENTRVTATDKTFNEYFSNRPRISIVSGGYSPDSANYYFE